MLPPWLRAPQVNVYVQFSPKTEHDWGMMSHSVAKIHSRHSVKMAAEAMQHIRKIMFLFFLINVFKPIPRPPNKSMIPKIRSIWPL